MIITTQYITLLQIKSNKKNNFMYNLKWKIVLVVFNESRYGILWCLRWTEEYKPLRCHVANFSNQNLIICGWSVDGFFFFYILLCVYFIHINYMLFFISTLMHPWNKAFSQQTSPFACSIKLDPGFYVHCNELKLKTTIITTTFFNPNQ